jgi:anti-sigma regulatory factor (Ser/Thr protein kinase)
VEDVAVELVRNSRDAGASSIYVASQKEKGRWRHLTVLDEGPGIPAMVQARIFESRVTSKVDEVLRDYRGIHGRGMALFSIRRSVESVELFRSEEGRGSIFKALVDLERLPERKDQSTWPSISLDEGGPASTGPHNILRSLVEFTFEARPPFIFLGSNAEILATLFADARDLARRDMEGTADRPLWYELYSLREGKELARYAAEALGVEVSERNAFRILEEDIKPLASLNQQSAVRGGGRTVTEEEGTAEKKARHPDDKLARRFNRQDLDALTEEVVRAAETLGGRYFLKPGNCRIQRSGNRLVVSILFDEE